MGEATVINMSCELFIMRIMLLSRRRQINLVILLLVISLIIIIIIINKAEMEGLEGSQLLVEGSSVQQAMGWGQRGDIRKEEPRV